MRELLTWLTGTPPPRVPDWSLLELLLLFAFPDEAARKAARDMQGSAKETLESRQEAAITPLMERTLEAQEDDKENHKDLEPMRKAVKRAAIKRRSSKMNHAVQRGRVLRKAARAKGAQAKAKAKARAKAKAKAKATAKASAQPAVAPPVVAQPAVAPPLVAQPAVAPLVVAQPAVAATAVAPPSVPEGGLAQPALAQPALAQPVGPAVAQPIGPARPAIPDGGLAQPALAQPDGEPPPNEEPSASSGSSAQPKRAAQELGTFGPKQKKQKRSLNWYPWNVAPVHSLVLGGIQTGWGATCGCHINDDDKPGTTCKKQLAYTSRGETLDDKTCELLVKQWLLEGTSIDPVDADARSQHLKIEPRKMVRMTESELEAMKASLFPEE